MVPVKIRDNGRLIQFKSRSIFLRMIGKSDAYLYTRHFKETNAGVTFQELWDRDKIGHDNLERHIARQKPLITDEAIMAYDGDHIIIAPISLIPEDQLSSAPVATGSVMSHPVFDVWSISSSIRPLTYTSPDTSPMLRWKHTCFMILFTRCGLMRSQQYVVSINNDPEHVLVRTLNYYQTRRFGNKHEKSMENAE